MLSLFKAGTSLTGTTLSAIHDRQEITSASATDSHHLYNPAASDSGAIIKDEDFYIVITVIECGIFPGFSLLGLPANLLNMLVFYRQGLRDKMNLCLFALAFVDFMFLFCMLLSSLYCPFAAFSDNVLLVAFLKWTVVKNTVNFRNAFIYSSGTLTAIIATERCMCVVWPLKSATIFKTKTMLWMIVGIVVVCNLLCLPYALKNTVRWTTSESGNVTVAVADTDLYINNKFAFQVVRDGVLPAISFATFFVISFVTVVTVRKLKTAMDWRQKTSSTVMDKRQVSLVKILIAVSCVYIGCSFPRIVLAIAKFFLDELSTVGKHSNLFFVTHYGALSLLMINSSVNFFIYIRQSSRFRGELHSCLCCFRDTIEEKFTS